MSKVLYDSTSPYYNTQQVSYIVDYLDFWSSVVIPKEITDKTVVITSSYQYRPDKLSFDLYQTPKLWWVFALRNPDIIKDPVWDFAPGISIQVPSKSAISRFM